MNFFKSLAAQKIEVVSQENLKTITDHLDQTQSLKQGGIATNYDVLRVEVQLSEAKYGILRPTTTWHSHANNWQSAWEWTPMIALWKANFPCRTRTR